MVRAYCLPRVELWENLALQFYTDCRGARLPVRVHGSDSDHAPRPFAAAAAGRALGSAAGRCCPAPAASSADPIVLLMLWNKGAPVCSDPGQQSSAYPGTKGRGGGGLVENVGINGGAERHLGGDTVGDNWVSVYACIEALNKV